MGNNGTTIKLRYPILYFDSVDIESKEQLSREIEENQKYLKEIEGELLALAMSTPKDICTKNQEENDPFDYVRDKTNETINELYEVKATLDELYTIDSLLDEWEYSYYEKEKELYPNGVKNAFREDKHVQVNYLQKDSFNLTPNDKSLLDIFNRAKNNVEQNRDNINFVKDKYIILFDGEIFSDYNDQFIFSSEENARKVLLNKFDLRVHDYINKDFIKTNKEFFYSFNNVLSDYEYNELIECLTTFESAQGGYDMKMMELINTIYTLLNKGILTMLEKHIKVVKLSDIFKSVEK